MAPRPNILIFHADQMRADALGCAGNPFARTPHIDALAGGGTMFTRHIAGNPVCMPSRASLLTGLYPTAHGVWTNGVPLPRREYARFNPAYEDWSYIRIAPEPPTLADIFAAAGYDTACFGKLHLTPTLAPAEHRLPESEAMWESGGNDGWNGPYYGFRHVELTSGHGEGPCARGHYAQWLQRHHPEIRRRVLESRNTAARPIPELNDLYASELPARLHNSAWIADRACAYLAGERPADRPFVLFLGFPDPHHPFTPTPEALDLFADAPVQSPHDPAGDGVRNCPGLAQHPFSVAGFTAEQRALVHRYTYAMVWQIDQAVGRVLAALEAAGLAEDTIAVFTSDHGDFLCDHGLLRKWVFASDCLLRVPFVLRAPGRELPRRADLPMSNTDVLPTLCALAGVAPPPFLHGRDIVAALERGESQPVFAYASIGHAHLTNLTCYDERRRYTLYPRAGYAELFDHVTDPGECRNLALDPAHASACQRMRQAIAENLLTGWHPNLGCIAAW